MNIAIMVCENNITGGNGCFVITIIFNLISGKAELALFNNDIP